MSTIAQDRNVEKPSKFSYPPSYNVEKRLFFHFCWKKARHFLTLIRGNGEYDRIRDTAYKCRPHTLSIGRLCMCASCVDKWLLCDQSWIIRMVLCNRLGATSCNPCQYSPSLTILVALWFNNKLDQLQSRERRSCLIERWISMEILSAKFEKIKTMRSQRLLAARLTQRDIFKTIFRMARPAFFRFRCY